jgi:hypothetical protein
VWLADISGAFDHFDKRILSSILASRGVPKNLARLMEDWLSHHECRIRVDGMQSEVHVITDQVFQGTVWGPTLWNLYIAYDEDPIRMHGWTPQLYADDLIATASFNHTESREAIAAAGRQVADEAHAWGRARRVKLDAGKESFHIVEGWGSGSEDTWKILGVISDSALGPLPQVHRWITPRRAMPRRVPRGASPYNTSASSSFRLRFHTKDTWIRSTSLRAVLTACAMPAVLLTMYPRTLALYRVTASLVSRCLLTARMGSVRQRAPLTTLLQASRPSRRLMDYLKVEGVPCESARCLHSKSARRWRHLADP